MRAQSRTHLAELFVSQKEMKASIEAFFIYTLIPQFFSPPPVGGVAFRLTSQHEHSKQAP